MNGIPGLSEIPLIGRLFAQNRRESRQTDIILTLTPHIVRVLDLAESDLRPFRMGRDAGPSGADLPQLPPRDRADLPGEARPPAVDPRAKPLNPFFPYPLPSATPGLPSMPGTQIPIVPPKKPGGGGGGP